MNQGQMLAAIIAAVPALYVIYRGLRLIVVEEYRPVGKAVIVTLGCGAVVFLVLYIVLSAVIPAAGA